MRLLTAGQRYSSALFQPWRRYSLCSAVLCSDNAEIPFPVENNDLGKYNWTGVQGIDPRPYATGIRYWYPRNGWGFPSNGEWEVYIYWMDTGATWTPLNNVRNSLVPGGWPRPGHRNHLSHILGNGGGQHWRLWDRHCTCPVIAPSITCPHVASLLRTILDSLGSTAHNLIPLQCAA